MLPRFDTAQGLVDGVNVVFSTSVPYTSGTTAVFVDGVLRDPSAANGWVESNPVLGQFTMKQAPILGQVVRVYYHDTSVSSVIVIEEVTSISGVVRESDTDGITATLVEATNIIGVISSD